MSALLAQLRAEVTLTLRNKESLLLTLGIDDRIFRHGFEAVP